MTSIAQFMAAQRRHPLPLMVRPDAAWLDAAHEAAERFEQAFPCSALTEEWALASYAWLEGCRRPRFAVWRAQLRADLASLRGLHG